MRHSVVVIMTSLIAAATIGLGAQTATSGKNEIKVGVSFVHPTTSETGISLGNHTGGMLEYSHFLGDRWAFHLRYLEVEEEIVGTPYWRFYPPETRKTTLHSLTAGLQVHFNRPGRVDPYLGFGLNLLYSDPGRAWSPMYSGRYAEFYAPKQGIEIGFAVDAGVNVRINRRLFIALDATYIRNGIHAIHLVGYGSSRARNAAAMRMNPFVATLALGFAW